MSTKPIREALALVREDKYPEALKRALEAVEAIEKAAKELLDIWGYARHDIEAERTMESIAKEAP